MSLVRKKFKHAFVFSLENNPLLKLGNVLILSIAFLQVAGQKKVDTIGLQTTYPFDEEFILKFPIKKNDSILYAYVYELKNGCIKNSICRECTKKLLSSLMPESAKALRDSVRKNKIPVSSDIVRVINDLNLRDSDYYTPYKVDSFVTKLKKINLLMPRSVQSLSDSLIQLLIKFKSSLRTQVLSPDLKKKIDSVAKSIQDILKLNKEIPNQDLVDSLRKIVDSFQTATFKEKYLLEKKIKFDFLLKQQNDTLLALVRYLDTLDKYIDSLTYKTKSPLRIEIAKQDSANAYIRMASLQPAKEYFLLMSGRVTLNGIDQIIEKIVDGDLKTAKELYAKAARQQEKKLSTNSYGECKDCGYLNFELQPFDEFLSYFSLQNISKLYLQIKADEERLSEVSLGVKNIDSLEVNSDFFKVIIRRSKECERCKDTLFRYQWFDNPTLNLISSITHLSRLSDTIFSYGYAELDFMGAVITRKVSNDQRIANLKKNLETLDQIISLLDNYNNEDSVSGYPGFRQKILSARNVLFYNLTALVTFEENTKTLKAKISNDTNELRAIFLKFPGFTVPVSAFTTSTYTWGFEGRTGFVVKADFGFMGYGDFWNDKDFYGVRPYLGFHVNFRPLNSEVPWNKIKGWKKHFSFTGGALVGTIKEDGKREGLIGNTSIFTGLGYAIGHGLRITPGVVWYNRLDPNPLITSKKIGATPYLGLSMDFRIQDVYKSFVNLF